jgi:DNA-binding beta-propeller fold protein YncE
MRRRLSFIAPLVAACLAIAPVSAQTTGDQLIVLLKSISSAAIMDAGSGATLGYIPTGAGPHEVVVSPDGRIAVVADYGTAQVPGRSLTVIDLATKMVQRTIDLGAYRRPHGMQWIPNTRRIIVTCEVNQAVLVIDVAMGHEEFSIGTGQGVTHMVVVSADGQRAWTANIGGGSVSLLDLGEKRLVKSVAVGKGPEAIDLSPDGKEVWVGDRQLNRITILDAATLDSLGAIPTGDFPNRLKFTPDGRTVLVSNARGGFVGVYDAVARRQIGEIPIAYDSTRAKDQLLGSQMGRSPVPLGILMHPSGRRAWVALAATDQIAELDIPRRTVTKYLATGREPDGLGLVTPRP